MKAIGLVILVTLVMNVFTVGSTLATEPLLKLRPLIEDLAPSWAVAVSPNERIFITQRNGILLTTDLQGKNPINYDLGLSDLYNKGQGGLLDVAFAPDYTDSLWVYLSYSFGRDKANGLKVIRVKLGTQSKQHNLADTASITAKETVFVQQDLRDTAVHYGARLAFLDSGDLLISTGDGFDYREKAQDVSSQLGKILAISTTGSHSIVSIGHRNPQGLIVLANGLIISHEHGPDGGDEINVIEHGNNYGWPVITYGKDYIGGLISPFTKYKGMQQPAYDWTPSIAPAGMIYYEYDQLEALRDKLLVTSLKFQQLHALTLTTENGKTMFSNNTVYFANSGYRMRDIAQTSSGRVFILSDGEHAKLLEVSQ